MMKMKNDETKGKEIIEKMKASDIAKALSKETSILFNVAKFEHCQRVATMLYQAKMWPDHLKTIGDALITLNLADRLKMDPVMVAQNISIIHGKPGFDAKLVIALINKCERFDPIQFEEIGNLKKPEHLDDGCFAFAKEKKSGKILKGPKIDWEMVQSEGWYNKPGSKWKGGLAPLMFRYRAASYFSNVYCPEVKLGLQTKEELQEIDVIDITPKYISTEEDCDEEVKKLTHDIQESPKVTKQTYQPQPVFKETEKNETENETQQDDNNAIISSFKYLKKPKSLIEFAEFYPEQIMNWPSDVFDAWCTKFKRITGEEYTTWVLRKKPEVEQKEESISMALGMVNCPIDGATKTANTCKHECPNPEVYKNKECLIRWP